MKLTNTITNEFSKDLFQEHWNKLYILTMQQISLELKVEIHRKLHSSLLIVISNQLYSQLYNELTKVN
jgi:hypothetical protein